MAPIVCIHTTYCNVRVTFILFVSLVQDWDAVEQIWHYALERHLRINPAEHPLMIAEPTFASPAQREKFVEILFEKFQVPAVFLCKSPVLATFACGKSTALVVESGAGHTTVTPVHDGYVLNRGAKRTKVAGDTMDEVMNRLVFDGKAEERVLPSYAIRKEVHGDSLHVTKAAYPHTRPSYHKYMVFDVLRDIKETMCKTSEVTFDTSGKYPRQSYELPDGNTIEVGNERFLVPECMFVPNVIPGTMDVSHEGNINPTSISFRTTYLIKICLVFACLFDETVIERF